MWKILVCFLFCHLHFGLSQDLCGHDGRFRCGDGSCISQAKVCNGVNDCHSANDENNCRSTRLGSTRSCSRNITMANLNNYTSCRKPCVNTSTDCRGKKECVCDDECGKSCINPNITCELHPPNVSNAVEMIVKRKKPKEGSNDKLKPTKAPYKFGDVATYKCRRGYRLNGPFPRCNGRKQWSNEVPKCIDITCREDVPAINNTSGYYISRTRGGSTTKYDPRDRNPEIGDKIEYTCDNGLKLEGSLPTCGKNLQWSDHTAVCAVPCVKKPNEELISQYGVECGKKCLVSSDCSDGQECVCGAVCSRVCVDSDIQCPNASTVANTTITYSGSGVQRLAHYQCNKGYYLHRGRLTLRCSSAAIWIGAPPECRPVRCGDPYDSIGETGGSVLDDGGTSYGSIVSFFCMQNKNLYGSRIRQCMEDGLWSGELTVCDYDYEDRCRHPGVPINGHLLGRNFAVGARVRFTCDYGYVLYGSSEQTCIINGWDEKEWSGGGAPECKYYNHPQILRHDAINMFTRAISQFPDATNQSSSSLGRSIDINDDNYDTHDIYFVIDVSASVVEKKGELKQEIDFAKRLVERMKNFRKRVKYGIMIFASSPLTLLSLTTGHSNHNDVIARLDSIYEGASDPNQSPLFQHVRSGTATYKALATLRVDIATARQLESATSERRKTHVFIFTDGRHNEGQNPENVKTQFLEFGDKVEFYSITACCRDGQPNPSAAIQELKSLAFGKEDNFLHIEDYYQLSSLLDKVTDVQIDYSKCGKAGDVGGAQNKTSLGRSIGGNKAAEDAWPWHAAITRSSSLERRTKSNVLKDEYTGSGSILSEKWILTAAHVMESETLSESERTADLFEQFTVFVGAFKRYNKNSKGLPSSIKAYEIVRYIVHPDFNASSFNNDIALIKIGREYDKDMQPISGTCGLTFGYYVRPVCLPCTGAYKLENGEPLLRENDVAITVDECRIEEKSLRKPGSRTVVTGFGHNKTVEEGYYIARPTQALQQVLLRIYGDKACKEGIVNINDKTEEDERGYDIGNKHHLLVYNANNICTRPRTGPSTDDITDACKGDSGGPMVREIHFRNNEAKNRWVQIGIVSFGYGCGTGKYPGYFTNVARYIPWINQTMEGALTGH